MDGEKKNTLLIVDDEKVNLKILTHILGADYIIYTATNGASAIEKAREYRPDLILLDIIMPEMDGYEILTEIKKCEILQKIPIIFITGLSSEADEEKGLTYEAADYIAKPFSATIVKLRVKNQIQIINQLRTIERMSLVDTLTDIANRRSFDERLAREWKQGIRDQKPISMLMIDIDKFKGINDTYGHQQGDKVLQDISKIYPQSFMRPSDFAARWGGEEFTALLPNTDIEGAMEIAEKIRSNIEKHNVLLTDGREINVTVSIGVNTIVPELDSSFESFVSKADKALYAAKEAGRNRVMSALDL